MLALSTAGAACALAALLISLRRGDRRGMQLTGFLFAAMFALMLSELYPSLRALFGIVAIAAGIGYALPVMFNRQSIFDWRRKDDPNL